MMITLYGHVHQAVSYRVSQHFSAVERNQQAAYKIGTQKRILLCCIGITNLNVCFLYRHSTFISIYYIFIYYLNRFKRFENLFSLSVYNIPFYN